MKLRLPFHRERLVTMQQFLDIDRNPHIYIITNKRVVEVDYENPSAEKNVVATLKEIKAAKPKEVQHEA